MKEKKEVGTKKVKQPSITRIQKQFQIDIETPDKPNFQFSTVTTVKSNDKLSSVKHAAPISSNLK